MWLPAVVMPGAGNHSLPQQTDSWSSWRRVRSKPVWLGAGAGATRLPPKSRRFGEADPTPCAREHPRGVQAPEAWVVTRAGRDLGTLSEERLHVLSHTATTSCFLINPGPCLNAESWGLEELGIVGGAPGRAGGSTG